jgi:hypothetical protein
MSMVWLPTEQPLTVRSRFGKILEVSPLNLYLFCRLKFKGNLYLFQSKKKVKDRRATRYMNFG